MDITLYIGINSHVCVILLFLASYSCVFVRLLFISRLFSTKFIINSYYVYDV